MVILSASRINGRIYKSRASSSKGYVGLKFQREAIKAIKNAAIGMEVEPEPWFEYNGSFVCSPDCLIIDVEFEFIIVVEIKYTYTPGAIEKLRELYCPVVAKVSGLPTKPLVLVKNLVPDCPIPAFSISSALLREVPLIQYLGTGKIKL